MKTSGWFFILRSECWGEKGTECALGSVASTTRPVSLCCGICGNLVGVKLDGVAYSSGTQEKGTGRRGAVFRSSVLVESS